MTGPSTVLAMNKTTTTSSTSLDSRAPLRSLIALIAALTLAVVAAPAQGAITIGSNLGSAANANCPVNCTATNLSLGSDVAAGGLRSPVNGTVTSWRFKSGSNGNQINLRVLKPGAGVSFTGGATSAPQTATGGINGLFATSLPISIGDAVGLDAYNDALVMSTGVSAVQVSWTMPLLGQGSTRDGLTTNTREVLVQAVVEPSNTLGFGKQVKNRKKGNARLTVDMPNAGLLSISGEGVKVAGGASRTIAAPGPLTLTIKAKGKQARKLRENRKVKLNPSFTFTPNDGVARTESRKVKLARN